MVLDAKIPNNVPKSISDSSIYLDSRDRSSNRYPMKPLIFSHNMNEAGIQWNELWRKFDKQGILDDRLLDLLWDTVIEQKPGLLGLMKKFDLICERNAKNNKVS